MPQVPRRKMPNIDTASMTLKESAIMTKEEKQKYEDEVRSYNSRMHDMLIKPMLAIDYEKANVYIQKLKSKEMTIWFKENIMTY